VSGFRVPGHTLRSGGHALERTHGRGRDAVWARSGSRVGLGVCSCGATSGELRTDSARKRWHQAHKLGLAEGVEPSRSWVTGDVVVHITSGNFAVLTERKQTDDGWWIEGGGGLADFVASSSWVQLTPAAIAGIASCAAIRVEPRPAPPTFPS